MVLKHLKWFENSNNSHHYCHDYGLNFGPLSNGLLGVDGEMLIMKLCLFVNC